MTTLAVCGNPFQLSLFQKIEIRDLAYAGKRMLETLQKICDGKGEMQDLDTLELLSRVIKTTALCPLGQAAPDPVTATLRDFRDEYEAHIKEHRCSAGVCSALAK